MSNFKKLAKLHQQINHLEKDGNFVESKFLHDKFIREAAMPVAQPYPVYQYPQYPQYQYNYAYPVQQGAYSVAPQQPAMQQPVIPQQAQPTSPPVPTPQTLTQAPTGQPNVQPNHFYYDVKTRQYYYKGKPVNQLSDADKKKMQEEMFKS
jgi:hypothetical protein